jgi:hypothetical protein
MTRSFRKNFIGAKEGFAMRTICEVLRELYWCTEDETVREKAMEASGMAKRMDAKLREYKEAWDAEEWDSVENPEEIQRQRLKQYEEEK